MHVYRISSRRNILTRQAIWFVLFIILAACSGPPGEASQPSTLTPEPIALPSATPSATPSPTVPPTSAAQNVPERIAFTAIKKDPASGNLLSVLSFVNSDGTSLEAPNLFAPFANTLLLTGRNLAWSPDGRFLAFDGANTFVPCEPPAPGCAATNYGTFIADLTQNAIIQHVEHTVTNVSWSPDGAHMVLALEKDLSSGVSSSDLYLLDIYSGQMAPLTEDAFIDLYPSWSLDGEWIAFIRYDSECVIFPWLQFGHIPCDHPAVYLIHPDGTGLHLLFSPVLVLLWENNNNWPVWSPDSRWLAFLTTGENNSSAFPNISIANTETGKTQPVARNEGADFNPNWMPDGLKLTFISKGDGYPYNIHLWDLSTGRTTRLTQTRDGERSPLWSPSGEKIAYLTWGELWIMDADGTNSILIEGDFETVIGVPAWQPALQP